MNNVVGIDTTSIVVECYNCYGNATFWSFHVSFRLLLGVVGNVLTEHWSDSRKEFGGKGYKRVRTTARGLENIMKAAIK